MARLLAVRLNREAQGVLPFLQSPPQLSYLTTPPVSPTPNSPSPVHIEVQNLPPPPSQKTLADLHKFVQTLTTHIKSPHHTLLYALLLVRRLLSCSHQIPSDLATPTTLLIVCVMIAESHLMDRPTPVKVWARLIDPSHPSPHTPEPIENNQDIWLQPYPCKRKRCDDDGREVKRLCVETPAVRLARMKRLALETLSFDTYVGVHEYATWLKVLKVLMG
ncbi:hypothetical protein BC829DRAFT_383807 [Chytridium lagenaria]|nr:hypothetical protein BC829DRAFT_383807 [Chytridium lagenaria]